MHNANEPTHTQTRFLEAWETAIDVAFRHAWRNATGHLNYAAVEAFDGCGHEPGTRLRFQDHLDRRAVLVIVAKGHNLVIFERFSPNDEGRSSVFVSNTTAELKTILRWKDGAVSGDDMEMISEFSACNAFGRCRSVQRALEAIGMAREAPLDQRPGRGLRDGLRPDDSADADCSSHVWRAALPGLEAEYPNNLFQMWIRPLQVNEGVNTLELLAPNPFVVRHINDKFMERIREIVRDVSDGRVTEVSIRVGSRGDLIPKTSPMLATWHLPDAELGSLMLEE